MTVPPSSVAVRCAYLVRLGVGAELLLSLVQGAKLVEPELVVRALRARNGCLGQPLCDAPLHRWMSR